MILLGLLMALPVNTWLSAHDFWIEPSTFRPEVGSSLAVRLFVGEHFSGKPFPRDPSHFQRFVMVGPEGEVPVVGLSGRQPAGHVRVERPGLHVIGYRSHRRFINLDGLKFESYLREEGLEKISSLRAREGQTQAEAREAYSRCSKSLVAVGKSDAAGKDLRLGFTLELVAEKNPPLLQERRELPVRLFYKGKPLQGALVVAVSQKDPAKKLTSRSDEKGNALFFLPGDGVWLIKAVHMVPAAGDVGADWESFWASLTFELP